MSSKPQAVHEDNHGNENVTVTINGTKKSIHRGNYFTPDLKAALGVPPQWVIDQNINGEFVEIPDNGRVVIKGGEVFVSHVRSGASS